MSDLTEKLRSYWPTSGYSPTMRKAADLIDELEAEIEELVNWINLAGGIKCPACDDVGWYVGYEGEQVQCQFCYECPDSLFNRRA